MRRLASVIFVCAIVSLFAGTARASVLWNGTFGSGSMSQWSQLQEVNPNRMVIVPDPAGGSGQALRVEVFQGDNPIGASGNRAEAEYDGNQPQEGDERYYAWSVFWPSNYVSAETWQLFTQWHQSGGDGSPPVQFFTWGPSIELEVSQAKVWSVPLQLGGWHTFVFHVKWSSDPGTGFVELYYDGTISLTKTYGATMFAGQGVYIKQGLYRNADVTQEQTVYHSGMVEGTSLDDVWPAASAGAPVASTSTAGAPPATTGGATATSASAEPSGGCATAHGSLLWPIGVATRLAQSWRRRRRRARDASQGMA